MMADVDDDLQSFIADCEWKTRKILRESNQRMKENARSLAAKDRVEKLKRNGSSSLAKAPATPVKGVAGKPASGGITKTITPLANKSKSLNYLSQHPKSPLSSTKSPVASKKSSKSPISMDEWKGRDKIIQDAYETIRSFPVEDAPLKAIARKGKKEAEKTKPPAASSSIHSSLRASPFCEKSRVSDADSAAGVGVADGVQSQSESSEPAMVTRRTIERDFYIMSKKRNNRASKRRQRSADNSEPTPELKTSVLRKKYRCDERYMKAKRKGAGRQYKKLLRLKLPDEASDDDEADGSDSSESSSDEEECFHAIHDLVERHIEDENIRSLRRSNQQIRKNSTFKPNVKEFWDHLQQDRGERDVSPPKTQEAESLPPQTFGSEQDETDDDDSQRSTMKEFSVSRYVCPYEQPDFTRVQLIVNEPLLAPSKSRTASLTASISVVLRSNSAEEESGSTHFLICEMYDPSNGSTTTFPLSDDDKPEQDVHAFDLEAATLKAREALLAMKNELGKVADSSVESMYGAIRQQGCNNDESNAMPLESTQEVAQVAPLSMRITGCSPYTDKICPGHAPIGKAGAWRFIEQSVEESADIDPSSMFPIWPPLKDVKYPKKMDKSQATAYFHRKSIGPQKGDCITVKNSMAFESPILSPYSYASVSKYIAPPFAEHEMVTGDIPYVYIDCTSLLENPVESRLDTLMPPPIIALDPGASEGDWENAPTDAEGNAYHCHELNECNDDGFRLRTSARAVHYDDTISSTVYGISEKAASPNSPATSPLLFHSSSEVCTHYLSRERTAADYHYIAESDGEGTISEPYVFATHMSAYKSVFVSRKSMGSYSEQQHFLLATKEAERKRLDLALKMKAAEELFEERLKERIAKVQRSVMARDQIDVAGDTHHRDDDSVAVELPPSVDNSGPQQERVPCDVELSMPSNGGVDDYDEGNGDLEQLANLLLGNANFLKAMARRLGIPEEQVMQMDSAAEKKATLHEDDGVLHESHGDHPAIHQETSTDAAYTSMGFTTIDLPQLKLNCSRYRTQDVAISRGDGWKRLPRSETIIGSYSPTKRNVQRGTGEPKFKQLEDNRNFISVNAVRELPHKVDSRFFSTEPKSQFISDLTTERLRLAKSYHQKKKARESMLSESQKQSLDEIMRIPVSDAKSKKEPVSSRNSDADGDHDDSNVSENDQRPQDHVTRAILAVKNYNLPDLELILDAEGISVETRDYHGNTLFILACQQGSKKLAKFLLRRGANMNAQNNGGNTALHYLYEYKHITLAEYLIRKGANDSIKNGKRLTCYEGLAMDI